MDVLVWVLVFLHIHQPTGLMADPLEPDQWYVEEKVMSVHYGDQAMYSCLC